MGARFLCSSAWCIQCQNQKSILEAVAFCGGHKSVKTLPHAARHSCRHEAEPLARPLRCQPPVPRPPHRWQDLEFVPPLSMKHCAACSTIVYFLWSCFFFFFFFFPNHNITFFWLACWLLTRPNPSAPVHFFSPNRK